MKKIPLIQFFERQNNSFPSREARDQALGWGISTSLIFSDLNLTQVCYWDIARLEVIIDNISNRWNGEFIELGFDHQTILHCGYKLSKGKLKCF